MRSSPRIGPLPGSLTPGMTGVAVLGCCVAGADCAGVADCPVAPDCALLAPGGVWALAHSDNASVSRSIPFMQPPLAAALKRVPLHGMARARTSMATYF